MKILLLGFNQKKKSYTVKRLVNELKKRGHSVNYMSWRGLVFSFDKNGVSIQRINGTDLKYYDYIIPKSPIKSPKKGTGTRLSHLYRHYFLVVKYINHYHKHALNEKTTQKLAFYDKLFQHYLLSNNGMPIVPSQLYTGKQMPRSVYKKFKKPYIVKSIQGLAGKQVFLVDDEKEVAKIRKKFGMGNLLVQKYIPTKYDYRLIVLNKKVLGAMKRTAPEGDFRTNVSQGGHAEKVSVSNELKRIAIKAASVFNAEFAGVDILKYKGKHYILEVNIFPGFEGFEKATGINVAKELVSYIEKKYLWTIETEFTKKEKKEMLEGLYKIEIGNLEKPELTKKELLDTILQRELLVIKKGEKPIAYLTHYKKGTTRRITRYGILPKYRGQRMGRRMLRALVGFARQSKDKDINAVIPITNKRRQITFRHTGFVKTKKILKKYFDKNIDGVIFKYIIEYKKRVEDPELIKHKNKKPKATLKK